jgi:hypothetical protein
MTDALKPDSSQTRELRVRDRTMDDPGSAAPGCHRRPRSARRHEHVRISFHHNIAFVGKGLDAEEGGPAFLRTL